MHTDPLGVALLVMVVSLILKALWDLKHAPNGADVRAALIVRQELDRRLARFDEDLREIRSRLEPIHDHITRLIDRDLRHDTGADD